MPYCKIWKWNKKYQILPHFYSLIWYICENIIFLPKTAVRVAISQKSFVRISRYVPHFEGFCIPVKCNEWFAWEQILHLPACCERLKWSGDTCKFSEMFCRGFAAVHLADLLNAMAAYLDWLLTPRHGNSSSSVALHRVAQQD